MANLEASETARALFDLAPEVRYVAIYQEGSLFLTQRDDLSAPSSAESDKYEELIVNPTVLTLLGQRGNIDCGGLEFVLIRYGKFFALVTELPTGHLTVGIDAGADALTLAKSIKAMISEGIRS